MVLKFIYLFDDKVIILYTSNDRETKKLTRKQVEDLETANGLETIKQNSLEPQGFKRVSLGGTAASPIELLIGKQHCFAVIKKKLR